MKIKLLLLIGIAGVIFALLLPGVMLAADLKLPEPEGFVNDFAGVLSQQTKASLESRLRSYSEQTGNEIAVVAVKDLQGTTIEDFAVRLFEKWKIGQAEKDNGVLLLVAQSERQVRIEVGYGLEPELTDAESFNIIRDVITPRFREGDFNRGVADGVDAIMRTISGEEAPAAPDEPRGIPGDDWFRDLGWLIYPAIFLLFGIFQWLVSILGRTSSWWLGGILGGIVGLIIMAFSVIIGVIALAMLVPLGLLFDYVVSRAYQEHREHHRKDRKDEDDRIPWWAGGHWGPGGFGGGRGGGFGGFGGGRSGGGGASGGW